MSCITSTSTSKHSFAIKLTNIWHIYHKRALYLHKRALYLYKKGVTGLFCNIWHICGYVTVHKHPLCKMSHITPPPTLNNSFEWKLTNICHTYAWATLHKHPHRSIRLHSSWLIYITYVNTSQYTNTHFAKRVTLHNHPHWSIRLSESWLIPVTHMHEPHYTNTHIEAFVCTKVD